MPKNDPWVSWDPELYRALVESAREDPAIMSEIMKDLMPQIDGDVDHPTECALWTGEMPHAKAGQLHGRFWFCGMAIRPYRLLFDLRSGMHERGQVARHMCLSKGRCCNLNHLKMGTALDNYLDRFWQSEHPKGPHISEVIPIYETGKNPAPDRIPTSTIEGIKRRRTWKSILGDSPEAKSNRIKYGLPTDLPEPFLKEEDLPQPMRKKNKFAGWRIIVIDSDDDDE